MIKFRIHPKIWEGARCKFEKVLKKCQNYRILDIFWDILGKMKDTLCQECVRGELLSFRGKIGTISPGFPEKMTVLTRLFHLSLPKTWHSHRHKNYILK